MGFKLAEDPHIPYCSSASEVVASSNYASHKSPLIQHHFFIRFRTFGLLKLVPKINPKSKKRKKKSDVKDTHGWIRAPVCEWERRRDKRFCTRGYCCFHTEYWFAPSGGVLFWVGLLNVTTRSLYPHPLNLNFLFLLPHRDTAAGHQRIPCPSSNWHVSPVRCRRGQTHNECPGRRWRTGTWEGTGQVR